MERKCSCGNFFDVRECNGICSECNKDLFEMRNIKFADDLERLLGNALHDAGIVFVHESESKDFNLDFYLPTYDVYLEVKKFHSERIHNQIASKENVIVVQGKKTIEFFIKLLK